MASAGSSTGGGPPAVAPRRRTVEDGERCRRSRPHRERAEREPSSGHTGRLRSARRLADEEGGRPAEQTARQRGRARHRFDRPRALGRRRHVGRGTTRTSRTRSRPCSAGPVRSGAPSSSPCSSSRYVIVADVLLRRRRWALARDLLGAALVLVGVSMLLGGTVASEWIPIEPHLLSDWGYPELRLGIATAVLVVVGPELVRPVRLLAIWLSRSPRSAPSCSPRRCRRRCSVRSRSGSQSRRSCGWRSEPRPACPRRRTSRAALASLGVEVHGPGAGARGSGSASAEYVGHDLEGRPLKDPGARPRRAGHASGLARRWRSLAYRDPPRSAPIGTARAGRARGARDADGRPGGRPHVPRSSRRRSARAATRSIVTRQPDAEPLENVAAEQVERRPCSRSLWRAGRRLHAAGISHGRLNPSNVLVVDGRPMLVDFSAATLGAPQSALDIDVAELLVACTVLVGPDRALARRGRRRLGRRRRPGAAVPPARRAHAASAGPRALARGRPRGAPGRGRGRDRPGGARAACRCGGSARGTSC